MAFGLAVYASQCRLPEHHARLASDCRLRFVGWDWPTGFLRKVSVHDGMKHPPFPSFAWRNFFLNVDNHLSLPQSLDQPLIHPFQATVLLNERIVVARLATTLLGGQGIQGPLLALSPPSA
jgi:hypothetical protein